MCLDGHGLEKSKSGLIILVAKSSALFPNFPMGSDRLIYEDLYLESLTSFGTQGNPDVPDPQYTGRLGAGELHAMEGKH